MGQGRARSVPVFLWIDEDNEDSRSGIGSETEDYQ